MALRGSTLIMLFTLMLAGLTPACSSDSNSSGASDRVSITITGETFNLELALDGETRQQGLSGRREIPADGGMIFVFPEASQQSFWMYDCYVPIDIIFLDPTGRVVSTHQMAVEPPNTPSHMLKTYPSNWESQFAIELRGGTLDRLKLKEGDKIEMPLSELKRRAR